MMAYSKLENEEKKKLLCIYRFLSTTTIATIANIMATTTAARML